MSDDISIPRSHSGQGFGPVRTSFTQSYRARRTGMDAGTRRLFMAASALGLVLLGGMAVWTFSGHRAAGIPVIQADTRPLRVKPDNPGGMTVIGANEQIMSGATSDELGDLAPAAEKPDPQALRAQRTVAPPSPTSPSIAATPDMASPPAPLAATPVAATGSDISATTAAAPVRNAGPMVQIAAVDSEAGATAEWARLSRKAPDLLGDRTPSVQRAEVDGKAVWRLRTGGFAAAADATEFCRKARAKGLGCSIASF